MHLKVKFYSGGIIHFLVYCGVLFLFFSFFRERYNMDQYYFQVNVLNK